MTLPTEQNRTSPIVQDQEFSLDRIRLLVAELERELAQAPADTPKVRALREEIGTLKSELDAPRNRETSVRARLHSVRDSLQTVSAEVEGELLKDGAYLAEIGRILGLG